MSSAMCIMSSLSAVAVKVSCEMYAAVVTRMGSACSVCVSVVSSLSAAAVTVICDMYAVVTGTGFVCSVCMTAMSDLDSDAVTDMCSSSPLTAVTVIMSSLYAAADAAFVTVLSNLHSLSPGKALGWCAVVVVLRLLFLSAHSSISNNVNNKVNSNMQLL
eukprot:TRINITY_DN6286_c0_g1_i4.p3 TRINITY_DN6286_c0_g1~~TRINITY_DN6286_c0_g1_i4.p3  ORF type:complete len:160 (+),score=18.90 TRINITY_DN6286_c0_g1_i4:345-824(+)